MTIFLNKFRHVQYINKIPYLIYAIIPIERLKHTTDMKNYLGCKTAFKNIREGVYYFCEEIEEAKIVY